MYKRYLLFAINDYYPGGGKQDVLGSYDTIKQVVDAANSDFADSFEVLDLTGRDWVNMENINFFQIGDTVIPKRDFFFTDETVHKKGEPVIIDGETLHHFCANWEYYRKK